MKRFLHYCTIISDNKYSDKRSGLLELNPMGKMYGMHTSHNYRDVMSYHHCYKSCAAMKKVKNNAVLHNLTS